MVFPRKTVKVGGCLAVVCSWTRKFSFPGKPILHSRPKVTYRGRQWGSARLSYHLNVRKISRCSKSTTHRHILHTCDHGWCIEPTHLYIGTHQRNILDIAERSKTWRINLSKSRRGKKRPLFSDQWCSNLSIALKKVWRRRGYKSKMIPILEKTRSSRIGAK